MQYRFNLLCKEDKKRAYGEVFIKEKVFKNVMLARFEAQKACNRLLHGEAEFKEIIRTEDMFVVDNKHVNIIGYVCEHP